MRVYLLALVLASSQAAAFEVPRDQTERIGLIMAVGRFAQQDCDSIGPNAAGALAALSANGVSVRDATGPLYAREVQAWLAALRGTGTRREACRALEERFGPDGDLIPNLVRRIR